MKGGPCAYPVIGNNWRSSTRPWLVLSIENRGPRTAQLQGTAGEWLLNLTWSTGDGPEDCQVYCITGFTIYRPPIRGEIMARPSKLSDPELYQQVIENMAKGVPQILIARSLGVPETTITGWKKRADFRRDLAIKTIEFVGDPIVNVRKNNPLAYLERHPATREAWAPPKIIENQLTIQTITVELPKRGDAGMIDVDVPRLPGEVEEPK
jgi:hypothetical protein